MEKRKFVILYLETGGGHISAARVLKKQIESQYPGSEVVLVNGFAKESFLPRLFFVDFYHISMNLLPALYSFVYRFGNNWLFVRIAHLFVMNFTIPQIRRTIQKEHPTDIINLHFALESCVRWAQRQNPALRAKTIVLDPFTCHSSWFYDKKARYCVFSERVKNYAVTECGMSAENIEVIPFIMNQSFRTLPSADEVLALKKKHGLPSDRKILLITGGGEGLPIVEKIVRNLISRNADITVAAVCGRDLISRTRLNMLSGHTGSVDLKVYGFIDFMDELVKCCDCAVIKAGPASMMEVIAQHKPVVISSFIYGQELGNVQFAVDNGLGSFFRKPEDICSSVLSILSDGDKKKETGKNFNSIPVSFDTPAFVDSLMTED